MPRSIRRYALAALLWLPSYLLDHLADVRPRRSFSEGLAWADKAMRR
jgi:hypothetical protein